MTKHDVIKIMSSFIFIMMTTIIIPFLVLLRPICNVFMQYVDCEVSFLFALIIVSAISFIIFGVEDYFIKRRDINANSRNKARH